MRRKRRKIRKKNKTLKIIVCSMLLITTALSIGYAAFQTNIIIHVRGNIGGATIEENSNQNSGGAIFISLKNTGIFKSGIISNNTGGAITLSNSALYIVGGIIKNNIAKANGGIAIFSNATFTYKSGIICGK